MIPSDLAIIITYCSKDKAFIKTNIEQCLKVTDNVVLTCGNKLFHGENEDIDHLKELKNLYPKINIVVFDVDINEPNPLQQRKNAYFPNKSRVCAYIQVQQNLKDVCWFLFIDADEIPEGELLADILFKCPLQKENNYTFENYWYFRDPIYRSIKNEDSPLLVHKDNVSIETLMVEWERYYYNIYENAHKTIRYVIHPGLKRAVFHHYSWVRSKEKMLNKIKGWSHQDDKDWVKLIEDEFSHDFLMIEPIHGNQCVQVENTFNLTDY